MTDRKLNDSNGLLNSTVGSCAGIEHFRKHVLSRDHVTSPVEPIGRLDEMFVAPTNRGVFTWPGVGPIHKKNRHGRRAAVATRL